VDRNFCGVYYRELNPEFVGCEFIFFFFDTFLCGGRVRRAVDRLSLEQLVNMKILFVCGGNVNRSQMAGTIFKSLVPEADVQTAGVYPSAAGERLVDVWPQAVSAMQEIGFDMSKNMISQLTPGMVESADRVVLMGAIFGGPIPDYLRNSAKLETWDVPDPGYEEISVEGARDIIVEKVRELAICVQKRLQ